MRVFLVIFIFLGLYGGKAYSSEVDPQQFFDQLAEAIHDPVKKAEIVEILNQYGPEHKRQARIAIEKEFEQLRPLLPMKYDQYTELQSVQAVHDAIRYNILLSQEYINKYDMNEFRKNITQSTINEVCTNPRLFFFAILDFRIIQYYYAPNNKIIKEIVVTEKDCT